VAVTLAPPTEAGSNSGTEVESPMWTTLSHDVVVGTTVVVVVDVEVVEVVLVVVVDVVVVVGPDVDGTVVAGTGTVVSAVLTGVGTGEVAPVVDWICSVHAVPASASAASTAQ
jgi:hypothetical protein